MSKMYTKKSNKKNSVLRLVLILLIIALLCISITAMIYSSFLKKKPFETQSLSYEYKVKNHTSFNLDTDSLHFGGGVPSEILQRGLNITSPKDAFVVITWAGDGFLQLSDNNFYLNADEVKAMRFTLTIPEDAKQGNYTGKILFSFYEP